MSIDSVPATAPESSPGQPEVNIPVTRRKRPHPQIVAWLVLLFSFGLFCVLVYSAFNAVSDYLSHSVQYKDGRVQAVKDQDANVFVRHRGQAQETVVSGDDIIKEGDEIRTDKNSDAVIYLFDGSRLDLTPGSRVLLTESRVEIQKFRISEKRLVVEVEDGQVRFTVAPFIPAKEYNESTVQALFPSDTGDNLKPQVLFNDPASGNYVDGTFLLTVSHTQENGVRASFTNKAQDTVSVQGATRKVQVLPGMRVFVQNADPGQPNYPSAQQEELVVNGSFINGVDSWSPYFNQGGDSGNIDGQIQFDAERIADGAQPLLHILRLDPRADGNNAETSLFQDVNRDVSEYEELWFNLKLKIKFQSLSGGGQLGVEYPFFIKINYLDRNGQPQEFFRGFYYRSEDSQTQTQDQLGRSFKIPQNEWVMKQFNLMDTLNKPARILRITVGSSGHLYDSYCTDVSLIGR
ncbi:MAG TPA: hypothetical protein VH186_37610 [Chloroflexia bacterium]|nr:hypothetical protein [Chloroflexia bacterium]